MENYRFLIGQKGYFKVIRQGYPIMPGTITNVDTVFAGSVRCRLEDGTDAACLYPPVENPTK